MRFHRPVWSPLSTWSSAACRCKAKAESTAAQIGLTDIPPASNRASRAVALMMAYLSCAGAARTSRTPSSRHECGEWHSPAAHRQQGHRDIPRANSGRLAPALTITIVSRSRLASGCRRRPCISARQPRDRCHHPVDRQYPCSRHKHRQYLCSCHGHRQDLFAHHPYMTEPGLSGCRVS